ncbi:MAG: ferrochelatase [Pseudomonadales bacterium]|nr:ferrochelatase [Pseudomonadales bacterium]
MRYTGTKDYSHTSVTKTGILLTNLGSPEAATPRALKIYLKQFLSDPRVIEVPRLLWWMILNGIILQVRPAKSARLYQSVWTSNGSPLLDITGKQSEAIGQYFSEKYSGQVLVDFAMRYGNPSIGDKIQALLDAGVNRLLILPLYPQYSATTTGSTFDAVSADFRKRRWLPSLRFITHYHNHPDYIEACCTQIKQFQSAHGVPEKLIFSYHGLPLRYLHQGDPYHCECLASTRKIAEQLGLAEDRYLTSFQSRFGKEPWLQPYTDETLKNLATSGVENVQVFCPGFSADCLETLEEIAVENKKYFLENGGRIFHYIPALNDEQHHINALISLLEDNLHGFLAGTDLDRQRENRFKAHPYNQQ